MSILILGFILVTALVEQTILLSVQDEQLVRCVTEISKRYFISGRPLAVSFPASDEDLERNQTKLQDLIPLDKENGWVYVQQHLLEKIHEETNWPILVYDSRNTSFGNERDYEFKHSSYIIFVAVYCAYDFKFDILDQQLNNLIFYEYSFRKSWNPRALFVVIVQSLCDLEENKLLPLKLLSKFWEYKIVNVITVLQDSTNSTANLDKSNYRTNTEVSALGIYTWFPYQTSEKCNDVKDSVRLDSWVVEGDGYFSHNYNLFPQKVARQLNGCPLRIITRNIPFFVEAHFSKDESSLAGTQYKDGWEIKLLNSITQSINMTEYYLPTPESFEFPKNSLRDVALALANYKVDLVFGGLEGGRWTWTDIDTSNSYFWQRLRWYVPCAIKYSRLRNVSRILSRELWIILIISLLVTSITIVYVAKYGRGVSDWQSYQSFESSLIIIWAVILGVSVPHIPRTLPVRVIFLLWVCFCVAFNTVFQTFLTTFLIEPGYENPIESIDQMLLSEIKFGYHPIFDDVYNGSTDENSLKILHNRIKCSIFQICLTWASVNKNISVIYNELYMEYFYSRRELADENLKPLLCHLEDGVVMFLSSVMMMVRGHPLLDLISAKIQQVVESGIIMQWKKESFDTVKLKSQIIQTQSLKNKYYSFDMKHLQSAFYLLLMGWVMSIFICAGEIAYRRLCRIYRAVKHRAK